MISWAYYAFVDYPQLRTLYLIAYPVLGLILISISWYPKFGQNGNQVLRTVIFSIYGFSCFIPFFQAQFSNHNYLITSSTKYFRTGTIYLLGGFIYAIRFPERTFPCKFDMIGSSHQIMHALVLIAALMHFHNLEQLIAIQQTTFQ